MSNRVINRRGARELTAEEMDRIAGGNCIVTGTKTSFQSLTEDILCPPGIS